MSEIISSDVDESPKSIFWCKKRGFLCLDFCELVTVLTPVTQCDHVLIGKLNISSVPDDKLSLAIREKCVWAMPAGRNSSTHSCVSSKAIRSCIP